jgi:Anti-sigma-K factor rskA
VTEGFDDLIDDGRELAPEERERLRGVHELLVAAGPPPEVPPALLAPRAPEEPVRLLPRRRRGPLALLAAAVAVAVFGAGFLVGGRSGEAEVERVIPMAADDGRASASIELLAQDDAGNWPLVVRVRGLEPSADRDDTYELWLTRDGRLAATCGVFTVHEGVTEVSLSVPYALRRYDGWVVTRSGSDEPLLST